LPCNLCGLCIFALNIQEEVMIHTHADVVGSLLRPSHLLNAQKSLTAGEINSAEFKAVEDKAVDEAIALQEEAGLAVVTDGEMRRLSFQSQLPEAVEGFGEWDIDAFLWGDWVGEGEVGKWSKERPKRLGVTGKLRRKRHLSAEELTYLRARTSRIPKITLTSPSLWANFWSAEHSALVYPTLDSFLADVVDIMREEVEELVRLGATYIQLDAPHYPLLLDPETRKFYEGQGWPLERYLARGIEMDNAVMGDFPHVTFSFHLCRGNQGSRWLVEGGYDLIARPIFQHIKAQRLMLEYDDERSGSFAPLRDIPEDKTAVLGLVTTKTPRRETVEGLTARIYEAAQYIDLERLALSPQCGFSTSIVGNAITVEDERYKLGAIVKTAAAVWEESFERS
jgi:5-methyltetrahydropteroyltriglutamate--homocysteine methyltransferase